MSQTIFITYHTEGAPFDKGMDLTSAASALLNAARESCDEARAYTPREIASWGTEWAKAVADYREWVDSHPDSKHLKRRNPTWEKTGLFMWKPLLLHRILIHDLEEGDVLIFHDSNTEKYPQYLEGAAHWNLLAHELLNKVNADVFIPFGMHMRFDVKAQLLRKYLGDDAGSIRGLWVGIIVIRKSKKSEKFLSEWVELCSDVENLAPVPNHQPHPEFYWHSPEQAVAGVLAEMWRQKGLLPKGWPRVRLQNRRFVREAVKPLPVRLPFARLVFFVYRLFQKLGLKPK